MPVDPLTITVHDARRLLPGIEPAAAAALAYLRGDIWQGGAGWVGPRPPAGHPEAAAVLTEIQRIIAGPNLVRALVGRHVSGVIGTEPAWHLEPEPPGDDLTDWWDRVVLPSPDDADGAPLGGGVLGVALARAVCGDTPVLRLRVRPGPDARPATLRDALRRIDVEALGGDAAAVLTDLDDGPIAVAVLRDGARSLDARLGISTGLDVAEVVALDEQGRTVIAVAGEPSDPLNLGGELTMYALRAPALITPSMLGIQRQAIKSATAMGRNTDTAGFVEVTYLNAERPGEWVVDPAAPGGKRFEGRPLTAGPGTRNFFVGVEQPDGSYANPSMEVRDPVDPATFLSTLEGLRAMAYDDAHQLHALIAGDATTSGESRRQAAADFLASLGPSVKAVEAAGRWLLATAYRLALNLMGQSPPADLRAMVQCQPGGTLHTVEEIRETREGVSAGLLARSTYQTRSGQADTEAEDAMIAGEVPTARGEISGEG